MTLYDELVARGLIAQVTDEKEIKELENCMGGNEHETEEHQRSRS